MDEKNIHLRYIINICLKSALDDFNSTNDCKFLKEYKIYIKLLEENDVNFENDYNIEELSRLRLCS